MSTLALSTISNLAGTASTSSDNVINGSAKAWVNFNGTGSTSTNQTIRASYNVSSVFKNGTGNYTINFTNAMPDANFAAVFGGARDDPPSNGVGSCAFYAGTTTTQRLITSNSDFSAVDFARVMVSVFR